MKTLISSLYIYNQNYAVVLYSYYSDKMEDDDDDLYIVILFINNNNIVNIKNLFI